MNKWIYHYYLDIDSGSLKERGSKSNRTIYRLARKTRKKKLQKLPEVPQIQWLGWSPEEDAQQALAFHLHLIAVAGVVLQSKPGFWTNCKTSQMDLWLREVCADVPRECSVKEINYRCLISHLPLSQTDLHYCHCHMANSVLSHGFGTAPASVSVISKCETQQTGEVRHFSFVAYFCISHGDDNNVVSSTSPGKTWPKWDRNFLRFVLEKILEFK